MRENDHAANPVLGGAGDVRGGGGSCAGGAVLEVLVQAEPVVHQLDVYAKLQSLYGSDAEFVDALRAAGCSPNALLRELIGG